MESPYGQDSKSPPWSTYWWVQANDFPHFHFYSAISWTTLDPQDTIHFAYLLFYKAWTPEGYAPTHFRVEDFKSLNIWLLGCGKVDGTELTIGLELDLFPIIPWKKSMLVGQLRLIDKITFLKDTNIKSWNFGLEAASQRPHSYCCAHGFYKVLNTARLQPSAGFADSLNSMSP